MFRNQCPYFVLSIWYYCGQAGGGTWTTTLLWCDHCRMANMVFWSTSQRVGFEIHYPQGVTLGILFIHLVPYCYNC